MDQILLDMENIQLIQLPGAVEIILVNTYILRKRRRATAWCGKSKFAISSGWLKKGSVSHPDDIITLPKLIRMRNQPQLSHPDDTKWKSMSSEWHNEFTVTHPDEIPTPGKSSGWHNVSMISHPDEILGIAKSSGWLRDQIWVFSSGWHKAAS